MTFKKAALKLSDWTHREMQMQVMKYRAALDTIHCQKPDS